MQALVEAVPGLGLVRRVITRPPESAGEDHQAVSPAEFRAMAARHAFLLHWTAHGLAYGIPSDVTDLLAQGRDVLVNLSRSALLDATQKLERLEVVALNAESGVLAERLARRGRETAEEIERRLSRVADPLPDGLTVHHVDNSGTLSETIAEIRARLYPDAAPP